MSEEASIGRNEPCPCGSGKKYKRCCGVGAAPKLGVPKNVAMSNMSQEYTDALKKEGFDPSSIPEDTMQEMGQMMQRLPKAQMKQLQSLMQRAMKGEDVGEEMAKLEKQLPPQFQQMVEQFTPASTPTNDEMSKEQAQKIVEEAIASGKISQEEAGEILKSGSETEKRGKMSKLWKGILGKK